MRSRIRVKAERRSKPKKGARQKTAPKQTNAAATKKLESPPGGKVLQRLFAYLGERDPTLNDDVVTTLAVPKAARPAFGLTNKALRSKLVRASATKPPRGRKAAPAARSFAAAIVKAANALATPARRGRPSTRKMSAAGLAPAPPPPAAVWQFIGPSNIPNGQTYGTNTISVIGRVSSIAVDPNNTAHLLLGAAGGGIWESTNTGAAWSPRTDQFPSLAIGAIVFDPTAPSNVYAGSGEGNFYANLGAGVYKSIDGGTNWSVLAAAPFVGIGFYDLVVDPANPTVLYAATTNGFYKSTNSGVAWSLKRAAQCWDISVHPNGGSVEILAAFADGLFVSTNAGNTFSAVTLPSAPAGTWARVAVDRVKTSPDVAYLFGAKTNPPNPPNPPNPHLWRRAGTTWTKITSLPAIDSGQAWYDWYVTASPTNTGQVFLGAIDVFRGTLSGSAWTFKNISTQGANSIHPDQHCLTFAPNNPQVIYAGSDGGIYRSANAGAAVVNWTPLNNGLGITEIEYLASDPNTWQWLMAGTQDNGTLRFTGPTVWQQIAQGDGGDCGVNQLNPLIVYHSYYRVSLQRSLNKGNTWAGLGLPWPPTLGSLFYPPVEVAGLTVAIGAASLLVTRTGANPWTTVPLGLPAGEFPSAMRTIDANTLLIGTTAGRILRVWWTGVWNKVQLPSPAAKYISCIAVDPSNPSRYWVTYSRIVGPPGLVFRSQNAGASWINCTAGLPKIPMNSVVVDPANFQRVWVAGDVGVYQTLNQGANWAPFATGLPNAMAVDLLVHAQDRKLICGTRNRGAWVIPV